MCHIKCPSCLTKQALFNLVYVHAPLQRCLPSFLVRFRVRSGPGEADERLCTSSYEVLVMHAGEVCSECSQTLRSWKGMTTAEAKQSIEGAGGSVEATQWRAHFSLYRPQRLLFGRAPAGAPYLLIVDTKARLFSMYRADSLGGSESILAPISVDCILTVFHGCDPNVTKMKIEMSIADKIRLDILLEMKPLMGVFNLGTLL
jgi:hypothetical protein